MEVPWDNNLYKPEKGNRFEAVYDDGYCVFDNETNYSYHTESQEVAMQLAELLNKQQSTISKQLDQIIELQDKYRILEFNHSRLEKRNKAQYEKIGEQQTTIHELRNENIISKNKIEDLRVSLFMADKELQRQMQKRDLDE